MNIETHVPFREGDWVKGTSRHDERFRGYVEVVREGERVVRVRVTQSDHDTVIGRVIDATVERIEHIADPIVVDAGLWQSLVDLALSTHDTEWFSELMTEKPQTIPGKSDGQEEATFTTRHQSRW